jgi:predicted RNA-binding Zn-ribbon protein involved in translation (DUF1610 family)
MSSKIIYHNHHIIPRHIGGTDDPSNLVRLTVEEHAEAHRKLYEQHGRWQDLTAWKALSGQITISEASRQSWIMGSYKGGYAKKPNSVSAWNKIDYYCVGCQKKIKPSSKGHIRCFQKKFSIPSTPNSSWKTSEDGKKMATKNNAKSTCPHCGKTGQYRAMKRWHYDNCRSI